MGEIGQNDISKQHLNSTVPKEKKKIGEKDTNEREREKMSS